MKFINFILIVFLLVSCDKSENQFNTNRIIHKTIKVAGGDLYEKATINFIFRGEKYKSSRNIGNFYYDRIVLDTAGVKMQDIITNKGFQRYKDGKNVTVQDSIKQIYKNALNSVHYFVLLPYGLHSEAVDKELIGMDSIGNDEYYEIKVTFNQNGVEMEHEDEYVYWINSESYKVDYIAYKFKTNGGGIRFRKAFNERYIGGIRFVDYKNYKFEKLSTPLKLLDSLYTNGELSHVSTIKSEDVKVKIEKPDR
ncbi:deoxyribose-phosphate aldolase [Antarcticibacterium flavum]|uniref:Deoxyribose-phosphate aldolase n=1 Tax=Antarcticibacterium flavum TaxID=2058175 RepID=A0A5B7X270_9FLAO|nr:MULTISPECIES: DUF6503 family protein [Antarcticibacterium]MCM4160087.1 deoxyribose-phosphate aldolase [Antarcticibacterium sp. W02-3]QCY69644.1 deoxyribose-phosphate aldolase [Antarcticibacterium flavum]